jgi:hypothetical protein
MLIAALALIGVGVVLGLFFPVMFVASAAGVVLLIVFLVAGARAATADTKAAEEGVDTLK